MPETIKAEIDLTPDQYGAIIACVSHVADAVPTGDQATFLHDIADLLRDAQRNFLGPMPIQEGVALTRTIQASEREVALWLQR